MDWLAGTSSQELPSRSTSAAVHSDEASDFLTQTEDPDRRHAHTRAQRPGTGPRAAFAISRLSPNPKPLIRRHSGWQTCTSIPESTRWQVSMHYVEYCEVYSYLGMAGLLSGSSVNAEWSPYPCFEPFLSILQLLPRKRRSGATTAWHLQR